LVLAEMSKIGWTICAALFFQKFWSFKMIQFSNAKNTEIFPFLNYYAVFHKTFHISKSIIIHRMKVHCSIKTIQECCRNYKAKVTKESLLLQSNASSKVFNLVKYLNSNSVVYSNLPKTFTNPIQTNFFLYILIEGNLYLKNLEAPDPKRRK
jgi:hypothetical protein